MSMSDYVEVMKRGRALKKNEKAKSAAKMVPRGAGLKKTARKIMNNSTTHSPMLPPPHTVRTVHEALGYHRNKED